MASTSSKMGLRIWNLLTDLYDHAQLADNWAKVDYHDHSPGRGVQVPTEGLADGAITSPKLATALDPTAAYTSAKIITRMGGSTASAQAAGTYPLSPTFVSPLTAVPVGALVTLYLDPDLWLATGRIVRYTLRGTVITNAVAPTATYSYALFPVATWGGTSGNVPTVATIGAAVAGSTTANIVAPGVGAPAAPVSIDFDAPVAGWYVIGMVQTGAAVANALTTHLTALSVKQV